MCEPVLIMSGLLGMASIDQSNKATRAAKKSAAEADKARKTAAADQKKMASDQRAKDSLEALSSRKDEYAARRQMASASSNSFAKAASMFSARSFFG